MSDYNEEIGRILGIYNCDKFVQLIEDIYEIAVLYDVDASNDWVRDIVGEANTQSVRLARTAYLLSRLAHHHADSLKKVKRSAPGFFQRAEKLTTPLAINDA